jgi:hypothetical protein
MTPSTGKVYTPVIAKIISLCGFPLDSTMVRYIDQQGWTELEHVTTIDVDEVDDFFTTCNDGGYEAKPILVHLCMFKVFLLYYKRKGHTLYTSLTEDDILGMTKKEFEEYCGSPNYFADLATGSSSPTNASHVSANASGDVSTIDLLTVQEFRQSVKRDKAHYAALKDDKDFSTWNRGFVATAHMHHTQNVLDKAYVPTTETDIAMFKEDQTFMYTVLEDHLKTPKGKSLVLQFKLTRDAQSIYHELKKPALLDEVHYVPMTEMGIALFQKPNLYADAAPCNDENYPLDGSISDGEIEFFKVDTNEEYVLYEVDTEIPDIKVQVPDVNCFGNKQGTMCGNCDLDFLPHEDWNKIPEDAPEIKDDSSDDTVLLAYTIVRGSGKSPGDIHQVIAGNLPPKNYKSRKRRNKNSSVSSMFQVGNIKAYSALDRVRRYQRLSPFGGETASASKYFGKKDLFDDGNPIVKRRMAAKEPKYMIGRMFLLDDGDNGQHFRAQVIQVIVKWANGESKREPLTLLQRMETRSCTCNVTLDITLNQIQFPETSLVF